jgi:hypothetical protein
MLRPLEPDTSEESDMRPVTVTVGPLATASLNAICLSQTPAAGALTLNGALAVTVNTGVSLAGVTTTLTTAVLDNPRRVVITTTANESAKTFTIIGTDYNGSPVTEVITGPNISTAVSNIDFKTVTSITISAAAAGALTVGTNNTASSGWVRFDDYTLSQTAIQATVSGTVTYTIQQTLQDPNSPTNPVNPYQVNWLNTSDAQAVSATGNVQSSYQYSPAYAKVTIISGTGSVTTTFTQFGVAPY